MTAKRQFVEKNTMLVKEFDRYVIEHPEFADRIPQEALIVMQVKDDPEFNVWARQAAVTVAEPQSRIVFVTVTELKPVRSRIERMELEFAA
jgi:hypothetical protein